MTQEHLFGEITITEQERPLEEDVTDEQPASVIGYVGNNATVYTTYVDNTVDNAYVDEFCDSPLDYDNEDNSAYVPMPDPTSEMLERPMFQAIWDVIKHWDVAVPESYYGYCGATGNHVRAILDALDQLQLKQKME